MISRHKGRKSRNGCNLCKLRKIKCDEGKPFCQQCLRKKKDCPGYSVNVRFSSKHEVSSIGRPFHSQLPSPPSVVEWKPPTRVSSTAQPSLLSPPHLADPIAAVENDHLHNFPSRFDADEDIRSIPNGVHFSCCELLEFTATAEEASSASRYSDISSSLGLSSSSLSLTEIRALGDSDTLSVVSRPAQSIGFQKRQSALAHQPIHGPTFLLSYWFNRICPVFSTFDSPKNPFRNYIDYTWQHSPSIYFAMQSMAAACVKDQLPRIASISIQLRGEAIRNLRYELENLEHKTDVATHHALFLACFMLGLSAAWHDSQDLGLIYFETAKGVFQRLSLLPSAQSDGESLGTSFCEKSLVYWQMLMAPVCKDPDNEMNRGGQLAAASSSVGRKNLPTPPLSVCPVIPHPFTGLAESAQDLLTKVIALTRRRREPSALDSAIKLEEQISRLPVPSEDNIQDTLDSMSPSWHFQVGAEAYKNAGLLQLYNAFPELVESRLLNAANENQDSEKWLISLAVHTIDLLKRIPPSSGTRCTQPLVFIISAAGLKFPKVITRCQSLEFESSFSFEISPFEVVVARSRTFVLDRLTCFERNLPSKPISTAIKLVREVWRQMDDENEVCWMDVMVDNQLESLFG